jgi:hypothetical protein
MNNRKKPKPIELPLWMDAAITGLAEKHHLSVSEEIALLTERAVRRYAEENEFGEQAQILPEFGMGAGRETARGG